MVVAIFVALWLPLKLGLAGAAKSIDVLDAKTGSAWPEPDHGLDLGKARLHAEPAHDIIQNRFHYVIDWPTLIIMAAVLIAISCSCFAHPTANIATSSTKSSTTSKSGGRIMWVALSYACWGISIVLAL